MLAQLACYPILLAARINHDPVVDWVRLPLAINLAGLPTSEGTRYYSEEQIELRTNTVKHAFKFARQVAKDYVQR